MSETNSMIWESKGASVQLLLSGKFRAINNKGIPKVYDDLVSANAWAENKQEAQPKVEEAKV